jgi:hypothetical protein
VYFVFGSAIRESIPDCKILKSIVHSLNTVYKPVLRRLEDLGKVFGLVSEVFGPGFDY